MTRRSIVILAVLAGVLATTAVIVRRPAATAEDAHAAPAVRPTSVVARAAAPAAKPDAAGAREAALATVAAAQRWIYLNDTQLESEVRAVATPEAADRLVREELEQVSVARASLATSPGRVWWVVRPLAWRADTATRDTARIAVWTLTVLSAADVAVPQADWLTVTVDLRWSNGRWLVDAIRDQPGPTPATGLRDEPWQPEPFDDALSGFTRIDESA
jgi:hypothetical protein